MTELTELTDFSTQNPAVSNTPKLVTDDETEMRLDRWFKRHYPALNHGQLEKLLRGGQIRVDGKRSEANLRLIAGQAIRIPPSLALDKAHKKPTRDATTARLPHLGVQQARMLKDLQKNILFMDDWVIALDKPAGLAVQGGSGTPHHLDGLLDHFRYGLPERPRLVHRLDRETSGVLILARTRRAAVILSKTWQMRHTEKIYWAIVAGVPKPPQGEIDDLIAKSNLSHLAENGGLSDGEFAPGDKITDKIHEKKPQRAVTLYRTLDQASARAAWLELRPLTGRTHQLRLHCLALRCPILADRRYGGADSILPGLNHDTILHLFARSLRLPHPSGKGEISITAAPPKHMVNTAESLGFDFKSRRHDDA